MSTSSPAWRQATAALALGCALALPLGELGARLLGHRPAPGLGPFAFDDQLGWVPRPGYRSEPGAEAGVEIGPDGLRSNGAPRPAGQPLLAVGDSFTFGDGVADSQSWPAALERRLGLPVLNGGASAYGFDQSVLRAERLLASRAVRGLVVALIRDDVRRCQLSAFCGWRKPWFDVVDGRLVAHGPVPRAFASWPLLEALSTRSGLARWAQQASLPADRVEHRHGRAVVALLLARLGALARRGTPVLLLIQGPLGGGPGGAQRFESVTLPLLGEIEERARAEGLATLDLVSAGWAELKVRPALRREWFLGDPGGHMAAAGNEWVAERLAARLRELGWLDAERP